MANEGMDKGLAIVGDRKLRQIQHDDLSLLLAISWTSSGESQRTATTRGLS